MLWDLNIENVDKTFLKYSVMIYMKDDRKVMYVIWVYLMQAKKVHQF